MKKSEPRLRISNTYNETCFWTKLLGFQTCPAGTICIFWWGIWFSDQKLRIPASRGKTREKPCLFLFVFQFFGHNSAPWGRIWTENWGNQGHAFPDIPIHLRTLRSMQKLKFWHFRHLMAIYTLVFVCQWAAHTFWPGCGFSYLFKGNRGKIKDNPGKSRQHVRKHKEHL